MMKEIVKRTLVLASLMILAVFLVSFVKIGATPEIMLVFELFALSLIITLLQQFLKQIVCRIFVLNILMEYLLISGFVLLYGYYVQWFFRSNWYMVFLYVAVAYFPAYFLDMGIVKKNVDYINRQLEKRRSDKKENADEELI